MGRKQYIEGKVGGECIYGVYCGFCPWCSNLDNDDRLILIHWGVDDLKDQWKLELEKLSAQAQEKSLKDRIWEITRSMASGQ